LFLIPLQLSASKMPPSFKMESLPSFIHMSTQSQLGPHT
jgi:hypothetical protein